MIVLSQQEARALGHTCIGTEHLLLGALTVCMESGLHDIDTAEARKVTRELVPGSPDPSPGQVHRSGEKSTRTITALDSIPGVDEPHRIGLARQVFYHF